MVTRVVMIISSQHGHDLTGRGDSTTGDAPEVRDVDQGLAGVIPDTVTEDQLRPWCSDVPPGGMMWRV